MLALALTLALSAAPKVGDTIPDFVAMDTDGNRLELSKLVKDKTVVVAFFPKAFTPGCTMQMKAFRDRQDQLSSRGAQVLAVAMDDKETMARFKKDLQAPFSFIPDPDGRISALFGMREGSAKVASRANIVISEDRKVIAVEEGMPAVDPDGAIAACPLRKPGTTAAPQKGPPPPAAKTPN
jgi:peroxiredoxin